VKNKNREKKKTRKSYGIIFLAFVVVVYFILFTLNRENVYRSLRVSGNILVNLIPVLLLVILFIGIANYFFKPKAVSKYLGKESGIKGWFVAALAGILSHGPIYVWYPLLKEFRQKGMRTGLIGVFLYNRAIKIPLLPLLIYYFGTAFTILLLMWMIIASLAEGKIIEIIDSKFIEKFL
jgi:uncharacterized membrane protein YraQ (UPF0718 family)